MLANAEAREEKASRAARKAAMTGNTKVFFMVIEPVSGSWNLVEIFSLFESSGVFTAREMDEIF